MNLRRTLLCSLPASLALASCGFQLRGQQSFAFTSLYAIFADNSPLASELRRTLEAQGVRVITDSRDARGSDVMLQVLVDQRERVVVGANASGQVREFQLRVRFKFMLRNQAGLELIPETELLLHRDTSYSETKALSKEAEEVQIYRTLQTDIVQQTIRRLAAVKSV